MIRPLFFVFLRSRMTQKSRALSDRLRLLLTITAYLTLDRRQEAFRMAVDAMRARRLTRRSVSELLLHLSLFLGYPVMLEGLEAINSRTKSKRLHNSLILSQKTTRRRGRRTFQIIYGRQSDKVIKGLNQLQAGLGHHVVTEAYGRIISRRGLDLAERELVSVTILFIKGFRRQLVSHVRGAMRAGVSTQALEALASFVGRFSPGSLAEFVSIIESIPAEKS